MCHFSRLSVQFDFFLSWTKILIWNTMLCGLWHPLNTYYLDFRSLEIGALEHYRALRTLTCCFRPSSTSSLTVFIFPFQVKEELKMASLRILTSTFMPSPLTVTHLLIILSTRWKDGNTERSKIFVERFFQWLSAKRTERTELYLVLRDRRDASGCGQHGTEGERVL